MFWHMKIEKMFSFLCIACMTRKMQPITSRRWVQKKSRTSITESTNRMKQLDSINACQASKLTRTWSVTSTWDMSTPALVYYQILS